MMTTRTMKPVELCHFFHRRKQQLYRYKCLFLSFSTESVVTGTRSHDCRSRESLHGLQAALEHGAALDGVDAPSVAIERGGHATSGRTAQARSQLVRSTHMRTRSEQDEDLEGASRVSNIS